jgi:hypothetical protein
MSTNPNHDRQPGTLERHAQSLGMFVLISVLGWVGFTVSSTDKRTAVIEVQMQNLTEKLREMQPASEARRDVADINRRLDALEKRFDALQSPHTTRRN